jgi:hypothetical protein
MLGPPSMRRPSPSLHSYDYKWETASGTPFAKQAIHSFTGATTHGNTLSAVD